MKSEHRDLLMLALGGELDPPEKEQFDRLLEADASLRAEWQELQKVQGMVTEGHAEPSFRPFFSTRVMARIEQGGAESLADTLAESISRLFRPLVPLTVAVALALALFNWRNRDLMGDEATFAEIAFGLPSPSVETAEILDL